LILVLLIPLLLLPLLALLVGLLLLLPLLRLLLPPLLRLLILIPLEMLLLEALLMLLLAGLVEGILVSPAPSIIPPLFLSHLAVVPETRVLLGTELFLAAPIFLAVFLTELLLAHFGFGGPDPAATPHGGIQRRVLVAGESLRAFQALPGRLKQKFVPLRIDRESLWRNCQ
jgi:hypothetical protein